jgi:hypothetical protein
MGLRNFIIINGYRGSFHPRSKLAGYSTEIKKIIKKMVTLLILLISTPKK